MFKEGMPPAPEKKKETPEEIWNKLTKVPNTPSALRRTLGSENVKRFMEILTSPKAVETDWLFLCGDLTTEEANQYSLASGDEEACDQELMDLAITIAAYLKPKLKSIVQQEVAGQRNEGLGNLFRALNSLYGARFDSLKLEANINKAVAGAFMHRLVALVGSDLIDLLQDLSLDGRSAEVLRSFIQQVDQENKQRVGIEFEGKQFNNEKQAYRDTFARGRNSERLNVVTGASTSYTAEERQRIEAEIDALLAGLKLETVYKKIPLVTLNESEPQIILMRDDPDSEERYMRLFPAVRINFQPNKIEFPNFQKDNYGRLYYDYGIHPDIVNFNVNPETGDLGFITSGVPLDQVMSVDQYLALKYYILQKLAQFLESKEPDIEDLFVVPPTFKIQEEEKVEPETVLEESQPTVQEEIPFQIAVDEEKMPGEELEPSVEPRRTLPKQIRAMIMDRIAGARPDEIFSALRRMLGKEVRIEGSHHFFQSERSGMTLPVPRHSQASKNYISLNLVLSNLKKWGYAPLELAIELGVKIPEKILRDIQQKAI